MCSLVTRRSKGDQTTNLIKAQGKNKEPLFSSYLHTYKVQSGDGATDANTNGSAGPAIMRRAFSLSLGEKSEGLGCLERHDAPFPR